LGTPRPSSVDLTTWTHRGVLLLNRVLTVAPGKPGSHRGKGWETVTDRAIQALAERDAPLVAILWGRDARNMRPLMPGVPCVESTHPSPMSAHKGFFGSRPFKHTNKSLQEQGAEPVEWQLPYPSLPPPVLRVGHRIFLPRPAFPSCFHFCTRKAVVLRWP